MERVKTLNPFAKRESYDLRALLAYKILTILTWVVVVGVSVLYSFYAPGDGKEKGYRTIWDQNAAHPTPFALNSLIVIIYWVVLLFSQVGYVLHLFASNAEFAIAAANVGSHFIINNLLQTAFVLFWVRSYFRIAEIMLILNWFNLTSLFFRHSATPLFVHMPVVSAPLAWTFVAIFWNGAVMVNAQNLAAKVTANVFIWSILIYGMFLLAAFKDYSIGFQLSILSAALAIEQVHININSLQWIFAFVITSLLFLATLSISVPGFFGKELTFRRDGQVFVQDYERRPLLDDETQLRVLRCMYFLKPVISLSNNHEGLMPPKPFPLAIGVGIDVCSITRVRRIVEDKYFNRWIRRVFNRREYTNLLHFAYDRSPSIFQYLLRDISNRKEAQGFKKHLGEPREIRVHDDGVEAMAQWCAGRWAAKEAAIKAHQHRQLYLRDVSVVTTFGAKPFALISPPVPQVRMNVEVAAARGLYGATKGLDSGFGTVYQEVVHGKFAKHRDDQGKIFFQRSKLYTEEDQQVAELSISHDGDVAMAVCMAVDEASSGETFGPAFIDHGSGEPIHEPEWGDRGFLDTSEYKKWQRTEQRPSGPLPRPPAPAEDDGKTPNTRV